MVPDFLDSSPHPSNGKCRPMHKTRSRMRLAGEQALLMLNSRDVRARERKKTPSGIRFERASSSPRMRFCKNYSNSDAIGRGKQRIPGSEAIDGLAARVGRALPRGE